MATITTNLVSIYEYDPLGNIQLFTDHEEALIHGAKRRKVVKDFTIDVSGGAGTVTLTAAIPDGAVNVIAVARVTTIIVLGGGGASWKLGDSDDDRYGTGLALTAGTVVDPRNYTAAPGSFAADTDITLITNAGTFTSGVVRLVLFFDMYQAPTS